MAAVSAGRSRNIDRAIAGSGAFPSNPYHPRRVDPGVRCASLYDLEGIQRSENSRDIRSPIYDHQSLEPVYSV